MTNIQQLMKMGQQIQARIKELQDSLHTEELTASSGGGMVTARVNGKGDLRGISIDREVIDPDDPEMLEDLVVAAVAEATFDGDEAEATRAVSLYNAYCARCHTAGYSAGPAYQQAQASGALGPSLRDGRALTQFLTHEDMYDFISVGSVSGLGYGVNGVGSGRMPGFGMVLSAEELELIVRYLRGSTLDGKDYVDVSEPQGAEG